MNIADATAGNGKQTFCLWGLGGASFGLRMAASHPFQAFSRRSVIDPLRTFVASRDRLCRCTRSLPLKRSSVSLATP